MVGLWTDLPVSGAGGRRGVSRGSSDVGDVQDSFRSPYPQDRVKRVDVDVSESFSRYKRPEGANL